MLDEAREPRVRGVEILPGLGPGKANAKHLALEAEIATGGCRRTVGTFAAREGSQER